jgi:hypothetical protein
MRRLEAENFEGHIGTVFSFSRTIEMPSMLATQNNSAQMRKEAISADLILTEVKIQKLDPRDLRATDTTGAYRTKPFSLFFESDREPYLPQGIYEVRHAAWNDMEEIFIVCLGPNEKKTGYLYQSVFG